MARRSPIAFFNNWNDPRWSFAEKVRMSIKNQRIKLQRGSSCCGNHGEPGC